ncbi:MAG: FHA domain-containing protein [Pseudomonadota bacterium]
MKILSRMLSKKIDPQNPEDIDFEREHDALDDAGQVRPTRPRSAALSQPLSAKPEEPEVAGNGWAQDGDWDDDWDDDEDWGAEDDPAAAAAERKMTEDKQHLVSEIREAVTSAARVRSGNPGAEDPNDMTAPVRDWSEDETFGRRARARSQLELAADETEDRLMEKTEDVMSDRETSRRRSAMAHMKAAAAATKADRVLRHVASRDAAADPEEQSPYRDDLAKVVRPHSTSRPISRAVSSSDASTPVWDHGAGDEDAALFAASENGMQEDPAVSIDNEMTAAEELRLSRAPSELSEEDFAADDNDFAASRAARDFPSSRFAVPLDAADDNDDRSAFDEFEHAAEDIERQSRANDEFDDPFDTDPFADGFEDGEPPAVVAQAETDAPFEHEVEAQADAFEEDDFEDDGPRPSSAVAEAIAFAHTTDEELLEAEQAEEAPEGEVRKKIWEMADEVAAEVEETRNALRPEREPFTAPHATDDLQDAPTENLFEVSSAAIAGRAGRSAGRVKTRLLGFQADEPAKDVFATQNEGPAPVVADRFPTGWIVVVDGPGRGASFSLHAGVSQIGRGEEQTVRLDFGDTSISRNNHAAVAFDEEQSKFFLGHGGKSNLVRLNGMPVLSTEEITDGDEIRIGETSLKFVALCGDEFSWNANDDGDSGQDA